MLEILEARVLFASVLTDQSDYVFGSTAVIYGTGFAPNESVQLQVMHIEGSGGSNEDSQNAPWTVQADANGQIAANWVVDDPDARGASYVLSAKGLSSGETANAMFTDAYPTPVNLGSNKNMTAGTTLAVNVTAAVAVGNTILIGVAMDPSSGTPTATDAKGNAYTLDADIANGSGTSGVRTLIFSAPVTTALASGDAVTVTFGASTAVKAMQVNAVAGLISAGRVDKVKTATGTGTSASTGNTATTTQADEFLFGVIGHEDKTVPAVGSTFTSIGSATTGPSGTGVNNIGVLNEYKVVSATGAYAATGTTVGLWGAAIVAYKPAIATVSSITPAGVTPTNVSSVSWTVTFARAVTGVDATDFQLVPGGGLSGASITGVTGSGTTWTVTASTGTGSGTLGLNLSDNDSIADSVNGIGLGGTGSGNGNLTGSVYTIDKAGPAAPSAPDMTSASDSGTLDSDNITNINTPTFTGTGEAGSTINLYRGGSTLIGSTVVDPGGNWNITSSALADGTYNITATASDVLGNASAASGALSVTIDTTAPTGVVDSYSTNEDSEIDPAAPGVLSNDTGGAVSAMVLATPPLHAASFALNSDGSFSYLPAADYNGSDSFAYRAVDAAGNQSTLTTVSITINAVNDVPVFTKGADKTVSEDSGAQSVSNWASGISAGPSNESGQAVDFIVTNDNNALFSAQPSISADGTLTFTPAADAIGSATVTVKIHDNGGIANSGVDTSASQTFVINISPVNDAPTIAADQASVTVDEGSPASNSGTFGDIDSGTVTISASVGTVTSDNGTWSWSMLPTDGPAQSQVVTITADDGSGGVATTTFNLSVNNVAPAAAIVGAPASSTEGTEISLTSSVSDAGSLDTFSYAWTVTKDGAAYASGTEAAFAFTPDDNGSYVVSLTVTDNDGGVASDTKSITVTNAAPNASIVGAPASSPEGTLVSLSSSVSDAGSLDTFTYAWAVTKDGEAFASGSAATFAFTPDDNGSYEVTLTVTDNDGASVGDTKTIEVTNVAPAVTIEGAPATIAEGSLISLASNITDAGSLDTFSYSWTVTKNGGAFASGTNSTIDFTPDDNGTYTVTLAVTDNDGGVGIDSKVIAVTNAAPVAAIVGAPVTSPEGTLISLSASVSDASSADTVGYLWAVTKNGESYSSGTDATFAFMPDDNGSYVVTLTVTDDDGGIGSDSKIIDVTNVNPVAAIVGAPASSNEGSLISLTSGVSDAGALDTMTYLWAVTKNGAAYASGSDATFSFTPDDNGSYVVTLTVTDNDGGVGSDVATITVTNTSPVAAIVGAPASSSEGAAVALTSSVSDAGTLDTLTYAWSVTKNGVDYANGSDASFAFTPDDNGSYVVTLTVTDNDGGVGSDTKIISVANAAPVATIIGTPISGDEGTPINLSASASDAGTLDTVSYLWSVTKNGNAYASGTDAAFSFTPDDNGSFVVMLTATDNDGGVGSDIKTIIVNNVAPAAAIVGAPASGVEGSPISLTSSVSDVGSLDTLSYAWTVTKNGIEFATGTSDSLEFTPDDNGVYAITLTVTDKDGGVGSDTKIVAVSNAAPSASIVGAPISSAEGTLVSLSSSVSDAGPVDTFSYLWSVTKNGGTYASGAGPSFGFTPDDNGSYVVTLTVTDDDGGVGSDVATINVTNVDPVVSIVGSPASSIEGTPIALSSLASDAGALDTLTYVWAVTKNGASYATGTSSTFEFTPDDNGSYVVTLTVTDKDGGVGTDSTIIAAENVGPVAAINGAPASSNEGTLISLTSTASDAGALDTLSYGWSVTKNGNAFASGSEKDFSFTPDDNGAYVVTLTVTDDDGGVSSDVKTITMINVAPVATIVGAPAVSTEGAAIALSSSVVDPGVLDTFSFAWLVTKNGSPFASASTPDFSFTPDDDGSYVVTLTVTDDDGAGSDTAIISVTNVAPLAEIVGAPASSSEGQAVLLGSTATDVAAADTLTYAWSVTKDGADYATGSADTFSFTPDDNGSYVVTLTVTDDDGGVSSDSKTITVTNLAPTASIIGAPAAANEGDLVNLTSSVADAGALDTFSYFWTVTKNGIAYASGTDAGFSFAPDDNGNYVVTLTVTDNDGAVGSDTAIISVTNLAPTAAIAGAPATSDEGSLISLTSLTSDVGSLDTRSHGWSVTKNGNGYATGAEASFSFTPDDNGIYIVTLTVTDNDGGVGSDTKTILVSNVAPTASIVGAPASGQQNVSIALGSTAGDVGNLDTLSYLWTVTKNGLPYASGTDATFNLLPDGVGSYVVTLTVSDNDGGVASDTKTISVGNLAPTASIVGNPGSVEEGTQIHLTASGSDPDTSNPLTFAWTVTLDGSIYASGSGDSFDFTPDNNGSYIVTLTAIDSDGAAASDAAVITVTNAAPIVAINGAPDTAITQGTALSLTTSLADPGSKDKHNKSWHAKRNGADYADSSDDAFVFTPDLPGTYEVTLTVSDDDGAIASDTKTIVVESIVVDPPPVVTTSITGADTGTLGQTLSFNVVCDDPAVTEIEFAIDWGDGGPLTHLSPPHGSGNWNVNHAFTVPGPCEIKVMKVVGVGSTMLVATKSVTILAPSTSGAVVGNDPWNPGATALFVTGTNATETISVRPQGGNLIVRINGKKVGPKNGFSEINGRVYIYGLSGNDKITVDPLVANSVVILGGAGHDKIHVKNRGNNVLLGQDGNDTITSGSGRDLIVGGLGMDSMKAGDGEDILVAGYTTYDHIFNDDSNADLNALRKIMAEWTSGNSYEARVSHLTQTFGGSSTAFNDGVQIRGGIEALGDNGTPDKMFGEDTTSPRGYRTMNLWIYNYDKSTPTQRDAAKDRTSDQTRVSTT